MKLPYNINKFHVFGALCMLSGTIIFGLNLMFLDSPYLYIVALCLFILVSAAFMNQGDKVEDQKMFDRIREELDAKDIFDENPNPNPDYEPPMNKSKTYHVKVQLKRKSTHKHPHKYRKYEIYYE